MIKGKATQVWQLKISTSATKGNAQGFSLVIQSYMNVLLIFNRIILRAGYTARLVLNAIYLTSVHDHAIIEDVLK